MAFSSHIWLARRLPLVAISVALTACGPGMHAYSESPALAAYFAPLVPFTKDAEIETVSLCDVSPGNLQATTLFKDGMLYTFEVQESGKPNEVDESTDRQRQHQQQSQSDALRLGCLGYIDNPFESYKPTGTFQFDFTKFGITAYVRDTVVFNVPFDEETKRRITSVTVGVQAAVETHKRRVPPEATWGVSSN